MTIFNLKTASNRKLENELLRIKNDLNNFFKFEVREPIVFFVNSRKDMDSIWGKPTEDWFIGAAKNNNIYIFEPSIFNKVSSHDKKNFWQILKHEYSHIYFNQITNNSFPFWLNEGLACYLSGKKNSGINKKNLFDIFSYFKQGGKGAYGISQFWVEFLIENFGKEKILELIKSIKFGMDEKDFKSIFFKVYNFNFNKDDFSKLLHKKN